MFSIVMMMKVNREEGEESERCGRRKGEGGGQEEERTAEEEAREQEEDELRSTEQPWCVRRVSMRPLSLSLSHLRARIRATAALLQPHARCITRRDLYSRLTSLCEGRIRSDTSLVCTRTVRPCVFDSLPFSLPLSLSLSSFPAFFSLRSAPPFVRPVVSL